MSGGARRGEAVMNDPGRAREQDTITLRFRTPLPAPVEAAVRALTRAGLASQGGERP